MQTFALIDLSPHPRNAGIYEDGSLDDLIVSIDKYGLNDPPVVNSQGVVLSGHRRVKALNILGWNEVQCRVKDFDNPIDELDFLVVSNEYRMKTNEERIREGLILEEVESKRAEERMRSGVPADKGKGETAEIVGKAIGMSPETFRQGKRVIEHIDKEEDPAKVKKYRDALKVGVHTAKRKIKEDEYRTLSEPKPNPASGVQTIWGEISAPKRALEIAHKNLLRGKSRFAPTVFIDLLSEMESMIAYLETWSEKNLAVCDRCGGRGKVKTPQGHDVKCDYCMAGKVPGV